MNPAVETSEDRAAREIYWRRRLRRLRFGAEPIPVQVERYRRVTIAMTVVVSVMALLFLAIFAAFHRPDIALIILAVFFTPILGLAWLDFLTLSRSARAYEAERKDAQEAAPRDL